MSPPRQPFFHAFFPRSSSLDFFSPRLLLSPRSARSPLFSSKRCWRFFRFVSASFLRSLETIACARFLRHQRYFPLDGLLPARIFSSSFPSSGILPFLRSAPRLLQSRITLPEKAVRARPECPVLFSQVFSRFFFSPSPLLPKMILGRYKV